MSSDVSKLINNLRDNIQSEILLQRLIAKTHGILNMLIGVTHKRRPISLSTALPLNGFTKNALDEARLIDTSEFENLRTIEWKL